MDNLFARREDRDERPVVVVIPPLCLALSLPCLLYVMQPTCTHTHYTHFGSLPVFILRLVHLHGLLRIRYLRYTHTVRFTATPHTTRLPRLPALPYTYVPLHATCRTRTHTHRTHAHAHVSLRSLRRRLLHLPFTFVIYVVPTFTHTVYRTFVAVRFGYVAFATPRLLTTHARAAHCHTCHARHT